MYTSIKKVLLYGFSGMVIVIAVLVVVSRLFTLTLDHHRVEVERWASELLKTPVTIKHIRLSWYQYQPDISLQQVTLLHPQTHVPLLSVKKVHVLFSIFQSLTHKQFVLSGLMISGTTISVNEKTNGEVMVQGFPIAEDLNVQPYQSETKLADMLGWLLQLPQLTLNDIQVNYFNRKGIKQFIVLHQLHFENTGDHQHRLISQVMLHRAIDTNVTIQVTWRGEQMALNQLNADLYLAVTHLDITDWQQTMVWKTWSIEKGFANATLWGTWNKGQFQTLQCRLDASQVALLSHDDRKTHVIKSIRGELGFRREGNKTIIAGEHLLMDFPTGRWPETQFYLTLSNNIPIAFQSGYINLREVRSFLLSSPALFSPDQYKHLVALPIAGNVKTLTMIFDHTTDAISLQSFNSRFEQLNIESIAAWPSVKNLAGTVEWDGKRGALTLDSKNMMFDDHDLFANPITLDHLSGKIFLQQLTPGHQAWLVQLNNLQATNADLQAKTEGTFVVRPKGTTAHLQGTFAVLQAAHIAHYLPLRLFSHDLTTWLKQAFLSGTVSDGTVVLRGKLQDFPFDHETGQFLITGYANQVSLHFAPTWPLLEKVNGKVMFSDSEMRVAVDHATLGTMPIQHVIGNIPDLRVAVPTLQVHIPTIQTTFEEGLSFVHHSPLEQSFGHQLADVSLTGPTTIGLSLTVPLTTPDHTTVKGTIDFPRTTVQLTPWALTINDLNGTLDFTEQGVTAHAMTGVLFNQPLTMQLETLHPSKQLTQLQASLQTTVLVDDVATWLTLPLQSVANGKMAMTGLIKAAASEPTEVQLQSNLQGIAIPLPAPYGKTSEETRKWSFTVKAANKTNPLQMAMQYDDLWHATLTPLHAGWQLTLAGQNIDGVLTLPRTWTPQQTIEAQFQKLYLPDLGNQTTVAHAQLMALPAINFKGHNVRYGSYLLETLSFETFVENNRFVIDDVYAQFPDLLLQGSLESTATHTQIEGNATTTHLSDFLNRLALGVHNVVISKGQFDFELMWPGTLFSSTIANLSGQFFMHLGPGRITELSQGTNAQMDFGRMLSVFSLQTIPRRLNLDFSDVFQQGYSFDVLKGDVKLKKGDAYTSNLYFDGPVARVDLAGRIGLIKKDYNLKLSVTPHVTSSIPVAATILTGQPVVGIAAWALDKVISPTVMRATTHHYVVEGPWDHPTWQSIS